MFLRLMTDFGSSQIATGTINLITDIQNWLYLIVTLVGAAVTVYFFARRSGSDEQDKKMWTNRIQTAIVSTVGGLVTNGIIQIIVSYYGS